MVYDSNSVSHRTDAAYFSLLVEGGQRKRIVMRPRHFTMHEGIVNQLRIVGILRPDVFLRSVSRELSHCFAQRAQRSFESVGFTCLRDVLLSKYDATLPDIDLLVISEEPTLGYVLFVCELKASLPPMWAKDHLKALRPDNVSKAFRQSESVLRFLQTAEGVALLKSWLPPAGRLPFKSFVVMVQPLVVTADNGGMFFEHEDTPIVSFRTLERMLIASDGDTEYLLDMLRTYDDEVDKHVVIRHAELKVGDVNLSYEGVANSPPIDFPQRSWLGTKERQEMIDDYVASGAHPFDVVDLPASEMPEGTIVVVFGGRSRRVKSATSSSST